MKITKENFNKNDPRCRVIRLDGKLYMAYAEDGGGLRILGEYNGKQTPRPFFLHSYLFRENSVIGELSELTVLLTPESMLIPVRWNGETWVGGLMTEEEMPDGFRWSFLNQCWARV